MITNTFVVIHSVGCLTTDVYLKFLLIHLQFSSHVCVKF